MTVVLVLWAGASARAHPLSPAALVLRERQAGTYEVRFRRTELAARALTLALPSACQRGAVREDRVGDQREEQFELTCAGGLAGQTVQVRGLSALSSSVLVYVEFASGQNARSLLTAAQPSWTLPLQTGALEVFWDYLLLGAEHLFTGWDHLLFILGLMFLARGLKAIAFTLTAFTFGHSITLCLAALELVTVPADPVELGIALSLLSLALALLAQEQAPAEAPPDARLRLPGMALALGLLHGLGFASALAETGLPSHQIPVSLVGFNLGVEVAQLAIVVPLSVLGMTFKRPAPGLLKHGAAYLIGALSACWCIERTLAWIG